MADELTFHLEDFDGPLELLPVTDCRGRRRLALLPL